MEKTKRKILIVDDDESIRSVYADVFKSEGYEVIEATDGVEGMDKATKEIPDIIFTGIMMPRMDGFGLKEGLSKNISTSGIPIVMSSHMGREEDHEKALKMGIKNFFVMGMTTPKEVVTQVNALFDSATYSLKLNSVEMDASRLSNDLKLKEGLRCPDCQEEIVVVLKVVDLEKGEFNAKIICPKCG
ncbi:MAG: response regulator [Candidatus Moraniibacteriota bacterium]